MAFSLSFLLVSLLLSLSEALVSPETLKKMSAEGSRYINAEIENAVNGVKRMKSLLDQTDKDHQDILRTLEETKKKKEDALKLAKESDQQLTEGHEVCNETMLALWEECKPCLKQNCVKFYSKICRSGSGLVGRRFEDFLNRSSPFSIWVNGERIDSLTEEDKQQEERFEDLEESYGMMEDGVDNVFQDSMKTIQNMQSLFFKSPFMGGFQESMRVPFSFPRPHFPFAESSFNRRERPSFFQRDFHGPFRNLFEMTQRMMENVQQFIRRPSPWLNIEDVFAENENATDNRMVCRELRRNSAGCLKMREKCEKCKEILSVDCSGKGSLQRELQEQFEDSMRLAEKFTGLYDDLLQKFQEEMLNTTSIFDRLNEQFGWVAKLANMTENSNGIFQVSTILLSKTKTDEGVSDTTVTVQLFDSEPITFTIPGDIPVEDPKFTELIVEEALKNYKKGVVTA
ncbi:clusterin [Microcaecilia unicolor]|uniref:Clusterin n=1 Tax=Microcaecilia unicolor TaxID=1415580 RepID=A0A6P7XVJ7_9AMPH|nr:clusterin [Microcaecilia unicolor]XP_030054525.1 clusterin [Microcaecilia unicolor]